MRSLVSYFDTIVPTTPPMSSDVQTRKSTETVLHRFMYGIHARHFISITATLSAFLFVALQLTHLVATIINCGVNGYTLYKSVKYTQLNKFLALFGVFELQNRTIQTCSSFSAFATLIQHSDTGLISLHASNKHRVRYTIEGFQESCINILCI